MARCEESPKSRTAGTAEVLRKVAVISARDAWAVGYDRAGSLIERWNGTVWAKVPSPGSAGSALQAVAATSAGNAWAVGVTRSGSTLVERWNGKSWS
jgi:hypothetical protein